MVLVEVSSFDGAKSPVGVVSSMMLARAGAVSSRVEPAAISSMIAASTSVASDGPSDGSGGSDATGNGLSDGTG